MKTTDTTDLKTLSADSLQKLRELGKEYQRLAKNQDTLLVKARRIIGFKTPNLTGHELDNVHEYDYHGANVFVEYARTAHLRWEKEEAVEKLKAVITHQNLDKAAVLKLLDLYY